MAYSTVIFDLDGTLLNTLDDLSASCNAALAACGLAPRTTDEVRRFVGNGIALLVHRAVPEGTPAAVEAQVLEAFKAHYGAHSADHTAPYPGVCALLARLKAAGVRCAVSSNKAHFAVEPLVRRYFGGLVDAAMGEQEAAGIPKKPAPQMVTTLLEQLGAPLEGAVYVGDSDVDIQTAANAGIPCVSVCWGFRDAAFLRQSGATTLVGSAEELGQILLS